MDDVLTFAHAYAILPRLPTMRLPLPRNPKHSLAVAASAAVLLWPRSGEATALADVPEVTLEGYQLVYREALPNSFGGGAVAYDVDNSALVGTNFDRVAYYFELQVNLGPRQFVYVSFNRLAGMTSANMTGIPVLSTGEIFQQLITSMNVASNVVGIVTGTGLTTGNIEFWSTNYSAPNAVPIPNASITNYDFGDTRSAGNYGSMQIHNYDLDGAGPGTAGQTIFAYNKFGGTAGNSDMGIGNNPTPVSNGVDWTFSGNAANYTVKNLEVLVHPVPEPTSIGLMALGPILLLGRRRRK